MIFLWPAPRFHARSLSRLGTASAASVEAALRPMFPGGEPVFVSSARAGIALALELAGASRADLVSLPPYASHCLIDAVGRHATPLASGAQGGAAHEIIYHQWGHVRAAEGATQGLFEDACDTLCRRGAALFPLGGRFEFWSLPKIAACSSGGIVWCRDAGEAAMLRDLRRWRRTGGMLQWILRRSGARCALAAEYWAGREAACGTPPRIACAEALEALERWDGIVAAREQGISALAACWPSWLPRRADRLPCALPIRDEPASREALRRLGADIGPRHYERTGGGMRELVRVLPVPLHQDMDLPRLGEAARAFHPA